MRPITPPAPARPTSPGRAHPWPPPPRGSPLVPAPAGSPLALALASGASGGRVRLCGFPPWKWSASLVYAPARRCAGAGGVRVRSAPLAGSLDLEMAGRQAGSLGWVDRPVRFIGGHLYVALPIKHAWKVGPTCASLASAFSFLFALPCLLVLPSAKSQLQAGHHRLGGGAARGAGLITAWLTTWAV